MSTGTDTKLDLIIDKLHGIENCLYGNGAKEGLRIDVDRLKRSNAARNAVLWVMLTTVVGIAGTVIAGIVTH